MWIYLGLVSAVLLGLYDVCKKHALNRNAVLPVLTLSTVAGFIPMLALWTASRLSPETMQAAGWFVPNASAVEHLLLLLKSFIVCTSWVLAYFAMKHLPISISTPIRSSGPAWTLLGATLLFHERPTSLQWAGIAVIFVSYYAFSVAGRKEGVVFHRSIWILFMFLATFVGTISTLFDKYLLQQRELPTLLVQFWFSFYNMVLMLLFTGAAWWPRRKQFTPFAWRWSIAGIGLLLIAADFVYFTALENPDALVVILSLLRRSSVLVSFGIGAALFNEANRTRKAWALAGVLAGVLLIVLA